MTAPIVAPGSLDTQPRPDAPPESWRDYFARVWLPRGLIVFAAAPNPRWTPGDRREFVWPAGWQRMTAQEAARRLESWRPGWCLALVTGYGLDAIDLDPRPGNGLDVEAEWQRMADAGVPVVGWNSTPSGGAHVLIPSTGYAQTANPPIGLDYRGGLAADQVSEHNTGRALLYLPGTFRPKYRETPAPHYVAQELPNLDALAEWLAEFGHTVAAPVRDYYAGHGMTLHNTTQGAAVPSEGTPARSVLPNPAPWTVRPGQIPAWLVDALQDPGPFPDRSARFHRLVSACRQAGLDESLTVQLLTAWDSRHVKEGRPKYGDRVRNEVARSWPKVTPNDPPRRPVYAAGTKPWHTKEGAWA